MLEPILLYCKNIQNLENMDVIEILITKKMLICPKDPFVRSALKHNSSQIQLISLSDCSVCLVVGVGGKLSRPVYLDPHPPEYQSKIIFISFLILNYLNVMMYQL